jgi:hypothetical protein
MTSHDSRIALYLFASATLVDFPQFPDVHHLIPRVLDLTLGHTIQRDYRQIEDAGKWEIYVKYRQIISQFLTDGARSGRLFVESINYVDLAIYLALFLTEDME